MAIKCMRLPITIKIADQTLAADLNDSDSAAAFKGLLPTKISMSRWGEEYYGGCGLSVTQSSDARDEMKVGELALWAPGNALCIFFGPTPASTGNEPRAASDVVPLGLIRGDVSSLKEMGGSVTVSIR